MMMMGSGTSNSNPPLLVAIKCVASFVITIAILILLKDSMTLQHYRNIEYGASASISPLPTTTTTAAAAAATSNNNNRKTDALLAMMGAVQEVESMQLHWDAQIQQVQTIANTWQDIGFTPQEIINLFAMLGKQLQEVACRGKDNDCYDGASTNHKASEYLRLNLQHFETLKKKAGRTKKNNPIYCETGFNYGKSSMAALLAGYTVYSFDVQRHAYSERCAHLMTIIWPGKFTMIEGSSLDTIPQFHSDNPEVRCNVLSIDGMHDYNGVKADFGNFKGMSEGGSLVGLGVVGDKLESSGCLGGKLLRSGD